MKLMSCLVRFGFYSGYKLNINKTQTLSYHYSPQGNVREMYNFKWNTSSIKYLGITIPKNLANIYNMNYGNITKELQKDGAL